MAVYGVRSTARILLGSPPDLIRSNQEHGRPIRRVILAVRHIGARLGQSHPELSLRRRTALPRRRAPVPCNATYVPEWFSGRRRLFPHCWIGCRPRCSPCLCDPRPRHHAVRLAGCDSILRARQSDARLVIQRPICPLRRKEWPPVSSRSNDG